MGDQEIIVIDNLLTYDPDAALSAKQGVIIKGLIDDLTASLANVATITEIDAIFA